MRSNILCREHLKRILFLLDRNEGPITVRDFSRRFSIHEWELEQAEELGWIRILVRKPRVGRPSRVVEKLSENHAAKLPPFRYAIPTEITIRHWRFALESVSIMPGGYFGFKQSTRVRAYLRAFPNAKSRAGASASASRLMKRLDVRVMRMWIQKSLEMSPREDMPNNVDAIIRRLRELGYL